MTNILIVDDQISSQGFMKYAIERGRDRYTLIETTTNADNAVDIIDKKKIDLVLLDIFTENKENGLIAAYDIKKKHPTVKIIVLTFLVQQRHIDRALEIGCEGFWYKDYTEGDLLSIMDKIMAGESFYPDDAPVITIGMAKSSEFTKREIEVLQAKANGLSNEEVCELLDIKERTLNDYIRNLKEKTGYTNMVQLIAEVATKRFIISEG